jgi:hypothetical protein
LNHRRARTRVRHHISQQLTANGAIDRIDLVVGTG